MAEYPGYDDNDRLPDEGDCNGGAILWLFIALSTAGCAALAGLILYLSAHGITLP